jgi:hypothetical protein
MLQWLTVSPPTLPEPAPEALLPGGRGRADLELQELPSDSGETAWASSVSIFGLGELLPQRQTQRNFAQKSNLLSQSFSRFA